MLPWATAAGVIAPPWAWDSSSETLYLTPLFAPGVTFHSQVSSKSPNVSTVIKSPPRSEEHTSELQSPCNLVCRLLLEKKKIEESLAFLRRDVADSQVDTEAQ